MWIKKTWSKLFMITKLMASVADENGIPRTSLKRYFKKGWSQSTILSGSWVRCESREDISWLDCWNAREKHVSRVRLKAFQLAGINPKEALAYIDVAYEKDNRINCSNTRSLTFRKAWRQRFYRNPKVHSVVKVTRYTTARSFKARENE
jgi:hypothetical protein